MSIVITVVNHSNSLFHYLFDKYIIVSSTSRTDLDLDVFTTETAFLHFVEITHAVVKYQIKTIKVFYIMLKKITFEIA